MGNIEFETHITVALEAPGDWARFSNWCAARALKCVHIALDQGQTPSQPMLTFHGRGTFEAEFARSLQIRSDCQSAGFDVTRIKLEVAPAKYKIARSISDWPGYFEHHIKLLLPVDADVMALQNAVEPHNARLSHNARRVRDDGQFERFVTQRCHAVAAVEAQSSFERLLAVLDKLPFPILETEREFVVFDSNLALDDGWFDDASES